MPNPNIRINNVPILEQNFVWKRTSGVEPYFGSFQLSKTQSILLGQTDYENAKIKIEIEAGFNKGAFLNQEISGLYLIEPKSYSQVVDTWIVTDSRYRLKDQLITCYYNKTVIKNEQNTGTVPESGKPSELRQDFDLFSVGRYCPWSVKADGKPYSVFEILQIELTKCGLTVEPLVNTDESYIIENIEFICVDSYRVIASLLEMSRLNMSINFDGSVYVYSIDEYNINDLDWIKDKQLTRSQQCNRVFLQDRRRIRPKKIEIMFEAKEELWVTYQSTENFENVGIDPVPIQAKESVWDDEDVQMGRVISCENVIPIPTPTTFNGKNYTVGQWVPMHIYLQILGITDLQVREQWFSNRLETQISIDMINKSGGSPLQHKDLDYIRLWVGNLKTHYRQSFRIDPYYMNRLASWETRRCAVVDNFSHYSVPSPLFADYSMLGCFRLPSTAKRLTTWNDDMSLWEVNERDPYRLKPTLGSVIAVNAPLGIFKIVYPSTSYSSVLSVYPFSFTSAINMGKGSFNNTLSLTPEFLAKSTIKESFEMQTIISATWYIDPLIDYYNTLGVFGNLTDISEGRRFYTFSFPVAGNTSNRIVKRLSRAEYARRGVKPRIVEQDDQTIVSDEYLNDGTLVNQGLLENIAKGEMHRLLQQYNDFYEGSVQIFGLVDKKLMANMEEIEYTFNEGTGFNSKISFKPVTPYKLEQKINQDAINFLHRQIQRGDGNLTSV